MRKISDFIVKHHILIFIVGILLLIPSVIGYINTRINYDILVYLPEKVDTIKGQHILAEEFHLGSFAFVMIDDSRSKDVINIEKKIKKISEVDSVVSVEDLKDISIPIDMIPDKVKDRFYHGNETMIFVTFKGTTSSDETIGAVKELYRVVGDASRVSSMTSLVIDTKDISDSELFAYVVIAVVLCLIVLTIATDSYLVPILLLSNIGIAIIYNMGSNIIFGEISYITKAITAILQLGVTTDFSIFLYNQYKNDKLKYKDKLSAMSNAIRETFSSVLGSSLTTFAGFLALCTMELTLGMDIGLVMAKGVLCGLICVITIFPCLLLLFDKYLDKTSHKILLPKFKRLQSVSLRYNKSIIAITLILLVPILYGYYNYNVYYKLDESLPNNLPSRVSSNKLIKDFKIVSPNIILIDRDVDNYKLNELVDEIEKLDGIDFVISPGTYLNEGIGNMIDTNILSKLQSKKYNLIIYNSKYEIASKKLNSQVVKIDKLVKKYDKNGMVAGEGALMQNLVTIADHDFKSVNYTSIGVIFVIMLFVLKSISLPFILIVAIEIAIFTNLSLAFYTGTTLPFISSIIVGTIQLGATIDYAILLSTTYLKNRKKYNSNDAMKETLAFVTPSIITSALCFFAATIGVGVYTKIDMIGSICNLLARGSIISMFVVLLILPSLLLIFEKLIIKTTKVGEVK